MLYNLQALRAFAALNVVFYHIIITSYSYSQDVHYLSFLSDWGANGVDIFFVISGFIMVYIQNRKSRTAISFLSNRMVRIIPIYWFLTMVLLLTYILLPSAFRELQMSFGHILSSFIFMSRVFGYGEPIFYVGWTLEYEMLFYILFCLGLFFSNKTSAFFIPIFLLTLLILYNFVELFVLEFVLGMICAKLYFFRKFNFLGYLSFVIGVIFLLINIFYELEVDRFFSCGIPAFFLVFGLININQTKSKLLVYLGDASYSIYLIQVFTIPIFYKISSLFLLKLQNDIISILALIFTTITGCIFYALIEKRMKLFISLLINLIIKKVSRNSMGIANV